MYGFTIDGTAGEEEREASGGGLVRFCYVVVFPGVFLVVFLNDVEIVASEREFVDVGAKFKWQTKERRTLRRACASQRRPLRFWHGAMELHTVGMFSRVHEGLSSEVDAF